MALNRSKTISRFKLTQSKPESNFEKIVTRFNKIFLVHPLIGYLPFTGILSRHPALTWIFQLPFLFLLSRQVHHAVQLLWFAKMVYSDRSILRSLITFATATKLTMFYELVTSKQTIMRRRESPRLWCPSKGRGARYLPPSHRYYHVKLLVCDTHLHRNVKPVETTVKITRKIFPVDFSQCNLWNWS